jgi:nitroreductase
MISMAFLELARKRRSIRKYKPDPVSDDDLAYVLEAARIAPSWGNRQCWKYIIVSDAALRQQIVKHPDTPIVKDEMTRTRTTRQQRRSREWIAQAPIIIVGCADPSLSGDKQGKPYYLLDMGISMEHLLLAAAERGLGTCWIGGQFDEATVKTALAIPDAMRVVALTPFGYPDETREPKSRKSMDEITSRNRWE